MSLCAKRSVSPCGPGPGMRTRGVGLFTKRSGVVKIQSATKINRDHRSISIPENLQFNSMDAQKSETVSQSVTVTEVVKPAPTSCRKKKTSDDATFLQDVKDHIDEFIHASMEEHKTCFTKTIQKMFGISKVVSQREAESKAVESALPLQTTVADQ